MGCHVTGGRSNTAEPTANASAGSVKAIAAAAPAPCAVSVIIRRRVIVSPSKAPGMLRSAVYFGFGCRRGSGTAGAGLYPPAGGRPPPPPAPLWGPSGRPRPPPPPRRAPAPHPPPPGRGPPPRG